jgi:hypothetical protein
MQRLRFDRVETELLEERPAAWTFARVPVRGTEYRYAVVDGNHRSRNRWEFVVHVPESSRERVEVRPVRAPNDSAFAALDRRSLTFMPATKPRYRSYRYCQLSLADPGGQWTRRVVRATDKIALPYWLRDLGWRLKQKATVRRTRGTDGHSLAALVRSEDHRMMICLFLGTKAWVLKRGIML